MTSDVVSTVGLVDDEPVLIKTASAAAGRVRLGREAALLDRLRHPGLVDVRAFDERASGITLTLRWAGSHTLRACLPMPVDEAAGTAAALAATVADLHDAGVAHTRIDADHVVVAPDGRPVLCGLGDATTEASAQADDVAALGSVLAAMVGTDLDLEPIPERSWLHRRRQRWSGYQRRALLNLADQAMADAVEHRPTARQLAANLAATVPEARLRAPTARPHADRRGRAEAAVAIEPTAQADPAATAGAAHGAASAADPGTEAATPNTPDAGPARLAEAAGPPTESPARVPDPAAAPTSAKEHATPGGGTVGALPHRAGTLDDLDEARWEALWHVGDDARPEEPEPGDRSAAPTNVGDAEPTRLPAGDDTAPELLSRARVASIEANARAARKTNDRVGRTRHAGLGIRAAAAVAGLALVAGGWVSLHGGGHAAAGQQTTRADAAARAPAGVGGGPTCATVRPPKADVDHDGCAEPLTVHGRQITVGTVSFEVGRAGDQIVVGDWSCRGDDTPAVLRPSTGEVFVFTSWGDDTTPLTVTATTAAAGADGLRAQHRGSCDVLFATRPGKAPIVVDTDPA